MKIHYVPDPLASAAAYAGRLGNAHVSRRGSVVVVTHGASGYQRGFARESSLIVNRVKHEAVLWGLTPAERALRDDQ